MHPGAIDYITSKGARNKKNMDVLKKATITCVGMIYCLLWPLLLTWFNFNPSMDM